MTAGGFELRSVVEVSRPPTEVFGFLADTRGFKALDAALVEVEPQGPLAEGGTGRFLHRRGGFPARTTWRVLHLEPPRRLSVEIRGIGYAMTETIELEATTTGTRATLLERVWPTSLGGRILVALSGGVMRRDLRARAALVRTVLEAEASAP